jgi:hypothetical protein
MNNIIRNILACIIGVFLGGGVNMALIVFGPAVIPPPAGVDVTNTEAISASIHLFEPKHFVIPFLAHALGTLSGSLAAFLIAANHKSAVAYVIGTLFLIGGISASYMIPAPAWFITLDLVAAYIPMAWISTRIGYRISKGTNNAAVI